MGGNMCLSKPAIHWVVLCFLLINESLCAISIKTSKIDPGPVTMSGLVSPSTDPSNSGSRSNSINLYTGQHMESFSLVAAAGTNGFGVTISLDYEGNVGRMVRVENRKVQASSCGLGFSLGVQSVVADCRGTASVWDDEYSIINGTSQTRLIGKADDSFITANGDPWIVVRLRGTVSGTEAVIGWKIIRENGTIYRFGDSDTNPSNWNATRNLLRYGGYVGTGVTRDDHKYPFQWDLKIIHDPDSVNWIKYSYSQETDYLEVINPSDTTSTTNSLNSYTRHSHLSEIRLSSGNSVELVYGDRSDYQEFYGLNNYEFYSTYKLEEIRLRDVADNIINRVLLWYYNIYLDDARGNAFKKLLLKSITPVNSDITDSLPATIFEYELDAAKSSFGSIKRIAYSTGAVKELFYGNVDTSQVIAQINFHQDDGQSNYISRCSLLAAGKTAYISFENPRVIHWDDNWYLDTLNHSYGFEDLPGVSPDDWFVVYDRGLEKLIVHKWSSGYWTQDTLPDYINRGGSDNVYIYPDKNAFMVIVGNIAYIGNIPHATMRRGYYFIWRGDAWAKHTIKDWGESHYLLSERIPLGPIVGYNMYAIALREGGTTNSYFLFGKYDFEGDSLANTVIGPFTWHDDVEAKCTIGPDLVAYLEYRSVETYRWDDGEWAFRRIAPYGDDTRMMAIGPLSNGIAYSYFKWGDGFEEHRFATAFLADDSLRLKDHYIGGNQLINEVHGTNGYLITQINDGIADLWPWNGTEWGNNLPISGSGTSNDHYAQIHRDSYVWGPVLSAYNDSTLRSRRYLGNGNWGTTQDWGNNDFSSSEDIISTDCHIYLANPYYYEDLYNGFFVHEGWQCWHYREACESQIYGIREDWECQPPCLSFFDALKVWDTLLTGKPQVAVVDSIYVRNTAAETDPIVTRFYYSGGLLNEEGRVCRFSRTIESLPQFASSAGNSSRFTVHHIYNDSDYIDTDQFKHKLDGVEYLSYTCDSLSQLGTEVRLDTVRSYYSLFKVSDLSGGIFRKQLDSVHTEVDGVMSDAHYSYDPANGLMVESRTDHCEETSQIVDSVKYAYHHYPEMVNDNTLTLVIERANYYYIVTPSGPESKLLSCVENAYEKDDNTWRLTRSFTFRDLQNRLDTIDALATLPNGASFDGWGHLINKTGATGDTSCTKYDKNGVNSIGGAANSHTTDFLIQDFEQGNGWDAWEYGDENPNVTLCSTTVFTGDYSLEVHDNPALGETNLAASRYVLDDSLTDSTYYFSYWVKTNAKVYFLCYCLDSIGGICQNGQKVDSALGLDSTKWHQVSGVINIGNVDPYCLYRIKVQLALSNTVNGWAYFDNLRFHRLDAHVTTKTYDPNIGQLTSKLDLNNIPVTYLYDDFGRPIESHDYAGSVFDRTEYYFHRYARDAIDLTVSAISETDSVSQLNSIQHKIFYELSSKSAPGYYGCEGQSSIFIPGVGTKWYRGDFYCASGIGIEEFCLGGSFVGVINAPDTTIELEAYSEDWCNESKAEAFSVPDYVEAATVFANVEFYQDTSIEVSKNQAIYYFLKCVRGQGVSNSNYARITTPDTVIQLACGEGELADSVYGYLEVDSGSTITIRVQVYSVVSQSSLAMFHTVERFGSKSVPRIGFVMDTTTGPNCVMTKSYRSATDSTVSITYTDGFGRILQTRTTSNKEDGTATTLVSGIAEYDARGRVVRSFSPYYDLLGSSDVDDYSPWDSMLAEINYYYNGTNAVNCHSVPYSRNYYYQDFKGRLKYSVGPDTLYADTARGVEYQYATDPENNLIVSTVLDQDDNKTMQSSDKWGRINRSVAYYTNSDEDPDSMVTTTFKNAKGLVDSLCIDSLGNKITLRRHWYDDLGREDSTWRVDYGTIRMLYDKAGNLRFMMNDKRLQETTFVEDHYEYGSFVYFKYDVFGRRIEEGLCYDTFFFKQEYADSLNFPPSSPGQPQCYYEQKYKWYFDHLPGSYSYISPGSLVKVQNGDSSYYRMFYDYPLQWRDSVAVKLQNGNGAIKSMVHKYDLSGNLTELTFRPFASKQTGQTGKRTYLYTYDRTGRLHEVTKNADLIYAIFGYNALGNPSRLVMGEYYDGMQELYDTAQLIRYYYDPRGMLTRINHPDSISDQLNSGGVEHPHFGMCLEYVIPQDTLYYNGLIRRVKSRNSGSSAYTYLYSYNELGWLTSANHYPLGHSTNDRYYDYNYLGNRTKQIRNADTLNPVVYQYYQSPQGTSRLRTFTGMAGHELKYDLLGNLIADTSRPIYSLSYDYRNLLTTAIVAGLAPNKPYPDLTFIYDEASRRIRKRYHYYYLGTCEAVEPDSPWPGGEETDTDSLGGGFLDGEPGDTCVHWLSSEVHYLYDAGKLLAIFDMNDNITQSYVNSPNGRVGVYWNNNDTSLYYFLTDHLGSTRVMVDRYGRVREYVNYDPFGEVLESWASYSEPLTFTGKQRDQHSTFDFYYFGSRYYDYRIGQFASVDKAGQGPGGYVYCGNNPIMFVDADGNVFFLVPILIGAAIGAVANVAIQAVQGNINTWEDAFVAAGIGAVAGGVAVFVPQAIGSIAGIGLTTSTGAVAAGIVPGAVAGAAGGFVSGFADALYFGDANLGEAFMSGLFGMGTGAVVGGAVGGITAAVRGKPVWGPKVQTTVSPYLTGEERLERAAAATKPNSEISAPRSSRTGQTLPIDDSQPTEMIIRNSELSYQHEVQRMVKPAQLKHYFGKPYHNLQPLVQRLGGQEAVVREVVLNVYGNVPNAQGYFHVIRNIAGFNVHITGHMVNGVPRIGTFFIW
jgi:RHS repeat-associated protein